MFPPLLDRARGLFHPALYHGRGRRGGYFEGWYYKFVGADGKEAWAVIPGVFHGPGGKGSHAFIQVLQGARGASHFHRFPIESFHAARDRFELRLDGNHFTADSLELNIDGGGQRLRGQLQFSPPSPWPWRPWAPGIMGPFTFTPRLECYHGVLSLDHPVRGALEADGTALDFTGGRGYLEKDWGRSFPRAWVWMQSNHFGRSGLSLTASIARIPWMGAAFRGFIVGFLLDGRLHRFATYLGSRTTRLTVDDERVHWDLEGRGLRLSIDAERRGGGLLHAPMRSNDVDSAEAMTPRVLESLTALIHLRLSRIRTGEILFEGTGAHGGLEVGGELSSLL